MGVPEIRRVGVVGLGAMGAGIAQLAVEAGYETDRARGLRGARRQGARADRALPQPQGRQGADDRRPSATSALESLSTTTSLDDLADCDLVIEAIVEELGAKLDLFRELERIVRPDTILATNTSALSVTEIASAVSTPERVVGMHFFNPAPLMPLVEIVKAELSSDEAVEAAFAVGERMGKQPIRCHDTPGFRRQPRAHPAPERLPPRARRGARLARGSRHGDDCRRGLADGAVHARRPRRASTSTCTRRRRCTRSSASRGWRRPPRIVAMRNAGPPRPQERPRLLLVRLTEQEPRIRRKSRRDGTTD